MQAASPGQILVGGLTQRYAAGSFIWQGRAPMEVKGKSGVDSLLGNPKFEVVIADGRHSLALDSTKYDVIEADAILPKTGLSGLLNSQEFFRQVQSKLAPGGLYVQWAPTERTIETFRSVFPYVTMVHPALLGSDRPIPYAREKILALLESVDSRLIVS